jgi:hypothetical protein
VSEGRTGARVWGVSVDKSGKRNILLRAGVAAGLASVATLTLVALANAEPGPPSEGGVQPEEKSGNPTCAELSPGTTELTINAPGDGTFSDGTLTVTLDVRDTAAGPVFDWTSNIGIDSIFVKGGPGGNLYVYDPEATGDSGLHAPLNPENNTFFGLSHISFCYDVEPPPPPPPPTTTTTTTTTTLPETTTTSLPETTTTSLPETTTTTLPETTTTTTLPPTTTSTTTTTTLPPAEEGCTPGFWKNHPEAWVGFLPGQTLESVFDVPNELGLDNVTLEAALSFDGGSGIDGAARILLRAAVAALLNAAHPDVDFPLTTAQVIAQVNEALASNDRETMIGVAEELDILNNLGCPS